MYVRLVKTPSQLFLNEEFYQFQDTYSDNFEQNIFANSVSWERIG